MEVSLFEQTQKKKLTRNAALLLFGIALFYAAVCTPLYQILVSDVLWSETPLPLLLDLVMTLANYAFYWIAFAYTAYLICRFGLREAVPMIAVYAGTTVFLYSANLLAGYLIGFSAWEDFVGDELPYLLLNIFFNLVLMSLAVLFAALYERKQNAEKTKLTDVLPFSSLFSFEKGMPRLSWLIACVPAAAQLLSRIRYDISYGAPRGWLDLLWMVVYYCSDLLSVLLGYLATVWIWNHIALKESEAKSEFDSSSII